MIEDQESIEGFLVFDLPRTRRLEFVHSDN